MSDKVIFWAAFLFGYTMNAITGFAGNIFAMPVGIATVGLQESIASLNVAGCLACAILAFRGRRDIDWRQLVRILTVMLIFMALGIWLDSVVSLDILKKVFAIFVLAVGLKNLIVPQRKTVQEWILWVTLALAGIIQGMFVCGGALLVIYATQKLPDKDQFRATLSMNWVILNFLYSLYSWHIGYMTPDVGILILGCIPLMILATFIGELINRRLSQDAFRKFTFALLVVIGVAMLIQ
ncbi:MAG: sulfite exporter TauE/SafE family protein [Eggerthellaceae bacterium]|jgi:uncharacterized membrane protein YfcA